MRTIFDAKIKYGILLTAVSLANCKEESRVSSAIKPVEEMAAAWSFFIL